MEKDNDEKRSRLELSRIMASDWDARARENAHYYIATSRTDWDLETFLTSGRDVVDRFILDDFGNISNEDSKRLSVLELGCSVGRVTAALCSLFGHVHAVDVSPEMIARARQFLWEKTNLALYVNNGMDLAAIRDESIDFAFSHLVFQHIPSVEVIEGYVCEVYRVLRPGCLFKFQVQGAPTDPSLSDTWVGATIDESIAERLASSSGFEMRHARGAGTDEYWLWFFKRRPPT